jgi:hypothetical protein
MSAKNIVNPDHYKIAGRDRPGENVVPEVEKQKMAAEVTEAETRRARRRPAAAAGTGARTEASSGARTRRKK